MKDDEYVRTVLSRDTRAQSNLAAQLHAPVVERALARSATARFKEYLEANTTPSVILAADGNPMGQFMNIDETRMVAVGERLIRGLYFYEKCERVPNDAKVTVGWLAGLRSLDAEMLVIARPFTVLKDQRDRAFGDAFSYMAGFGPKASVWLLVLYDYIFWAGTILDADHAAIRPMKPSDESHSPRESGTSGWLGTAYW